MNFWEKLEHGIVLFDGAMGTYYMEKYGHQPESCERANIEFPERVERIHREYIAAGANAVKTNTFSANPHSLKCGLSEVFDIIESGWELATRAAAGTDVAVFADIGPIPGSDNVELYKKIADKFLEMGADCFLFETFSNPDGLDEVFAHIKKVNPESRILCSFAVAPDGFTREGLPLFQLDAAMSQNADVHAWGLNCVSGPNHMLKLMTGPHDLRRPLIAMPNAGYPTTVGNRTYFESDPDYYARSLMDIANAGAKIIGGCCGTTPEHIKRVRALLDAQDHKAKVYAQRPPLIEIEPAENKLWDKLRSGKKVIVVELDPPANSDIRAFMDCARALQDHGADAITIADCPISRARADSSLLACKLKRELGIDPIPHMTCRDRNITATKALLLGLNIEGVNNVLAVTGDPVPSAERKIIKSVFNFNSVVLASLIRNLSGEFCRGPFRIFGALNINALNFDSELKRASAKLENGMDGFFTQPLHSLRALENLKTARNELPGAKIFGGLMPIVSYRNARFMNSEIPGITVPEELALRYKDLDKDEASKLAVSVTTDFAISMKDHIDGFYLITPFMRVDLICEIMGNIG